MTDVAVPIRQVLQAIMAIARTPISRKFKRSAFPLAIYATLAFETA
jgi:hypothetical protein